MPSQKIISNPLKDKGLVISVFSLFIFSTFSIAGIEFFPITLMSFALWHYFSTDSLLAVLLPMLNMSQILQ
jgi:hypothetical protein